MELFRVVMKYQKKFYTGIQILIIKNIVKLWKMWENHANNTHNCTCMKYIYIYGKQEVSLKIIQMIEFSKTSF